MPNNMGMANSDYKFYTHLPALCCNKEMASYTAKNKTRKSNDGDYNLVLFC